MSNNITLEQVIIWVQQLQDQNKIDFQAIKLINKTLERLKNEIEKGNNLNNLVIKKMMYEYNQLKKIIIDENVALTLNQKIIDSENKNKKKIEEVDNKLKNEINEVSSQLDNKTNLSNKRIYVINETTDNEGVIDLANFSGQGTALKDIMAKLHNYTDSDVMWLDNVGEGNTILRLNNSRNPVRREDKDNDYVGSGDYLILGRHKNDGSIYYQVLKIDKDGNFIFKNNPALTGAVKFDNNKMATDGEPAFIFRTPSATHNEVLKLKTGGSDRELFSFGGHASGTLALINVGSLMTQGLAITFPAITETQHLKFGTANNPYTVPNVIVKAFAPTSITPHFIGQMFVNTIDKSVYMATEVVAGGWTKLSN